MPLVVEDGSGLPNADAYVSLEECDDYHSAMGNAAWVADPDDGENTAAREAAIRRATVFLDSRFGRRFRGRRARGNQKLLWPRTGAFDEDGYELDGIPDPVRYAVCEAALRAFSGTDLLPDLERGGQVVQETIGPISTTYATGAPAGTRFSIIEGLLAPCLVEAGIRAVRA